MSKKLVCKDPVPSDLEVSQEAETEPIASITERAGIRPDEFEPYGFWAGKVSLDVRDRLADAEDGNYVVVTAITPTPLGEGKSTTTVGLSQALGAHLEKKVLALRPRLPAAANRSRGRVRGGRCSRAFDSPVR